MQCQGCKKVHWQLEAAEPVGTHGRCPGYGTSTFTHFLEREESSVNKKCVVGLGEWN